METYSFLQTNDPYFLTPPELVQAKLELLNLEDGEVLCDLGVGDGRSLIAGCEQAKVTAIGYEVLPEAMVTAQKNIDAANLTHRIELIEGSMYDADVSQVNALLLYLSRTMLGGLSLKLENELPAGARIVTHEFDLPGWVILQEKEITLSNGDWYTIYLFRKP